MATQQGVSQPARPPGRPRREIDMAEVADAVLDQCAAGGQESVTIDRIAEQLSLSRSTLYRTVPSREHLLGIALEHRTKRLADDARHVLDDVSGEMERLEALISLQVEAAVATRGYLFVFFASGILPAEMHHAWRRWARDYEELWRSVVADAIAAGVLPEDDPAITTRLLLGMCIWVSRWYEPERDPDAGELARSVLRVVTAPPAAP